MIRDNHAVKQKYEEKNHVVITELVNKFFEPPKY